MSDDSDGAIFRLCFLRKELHFIYYPMLKITEPFAARRRQMGPLQDPLASVGFVSSFNFLPGKTFPSAEVDLS